MNSLNKWALLAPILKATATYFFLAGLVLALFPTRIFMMLGVPVPYPVFLARSVGIIAAVYGFCLALASNTLIRNWLLLFAGLLSTLILILLLLVGVITGQIMAEPGWWVILTLLIGHVPLGLIVGRLARTPAGGPPPPKPLPTELHLDQFVTQDGRSLASLSDEGPVLLVLLRHLGCTFCRETLADIAAQRHAIESAGARIVFVHMGEDEKTRYLFERYRLEDIPRISDPEAALYRTLGLERTSFLKVYGPGMWRYTVQSILLDGHGMGQIVGDRFQMPGAFLINRSAVVSGFRHKRISDHPDYMGMVRCLNSGEDINF